MPKRPQKKRAPSCSGGSYKDRAAVLRYLGFGSYREYLDSPLWAEVREKIFKCKGRACLTCGRFATQIHHNRYNYRTMIGRSFKNVAPICHGCHKAIEFDKGEKIKKVSDVHKRHNKRRKWFQIRNRTPQPAQPEIRRAEMEHSLLNHQFDAMFRHG